MTDGKTGIYIKYIGMARHAYIFIPNPEPDIP